MGLNVVSKLRRGEHKVAVIDSIYSKRVKLLPDLFKTSQAVTFRNAAAGVNSL